MQPLIAIAKDAAERIRKENRLIHIVSHYDADGITSAAIFACTMMKLQKKFHLTIVKQIKPEVIERLKQSEPVLIIFSDIGSGYLNDIEKLDCDIIVADHHEIEKVWTSNRLIHVNPELFGIKNLSGSVVSYIICRELTKDTDEAPLALVGSVGDLSLIDASIVDSPNIQTEKGLKLYGRFGKPLHSALASEPDIGNESSALQLLVELGIAPQNHEGWRTLADLDKKERQKLTDALVREKLAHGHSVDELFGDVWTLKGWPDELADAREFATLLNACGRMESATVGVAVCMGSAKALQAARALAKEYKRKLGTAMEWLENHKEVIRRTDHATYILAGDSISENLIGTIVSMMIRENIGKPMIGLAKSEDGVKVSSRSTTCNINKIIAKATSVVGGRAGGHAEAAGATIPAGTEERFVAECEEHLKSL